ncbi:isocitrate lyase/phosphoenolpyruvate mutase family protein [Streptomyces canus]|nr:isocitrate lyase/phosphoenolpyruvate mutase family protein [Streptomyces canus]
MPAAGAVGVSIEDAQYPGEPLRAIGEQAERIAAAREAADAEGVPVFVNARIVPAPHRTAPHRTGPEGERAAAYLAVAADGSFVPGDRRTPGRRRGRTDERHGRIRHPPVAEPADGLDRGELNVLFGGPLQ